MLGCKLHILIERLCHLAFDIPAEVQMQLCISGELCNGYPLFSFSQRAELPECSKVHSVTLKDQFEEASKKRDYRIEEEVYTYLQSFLKDNERKIEGAKKRLILTQETPEMEEKVCDTYIHMAVYMYMYTCMHMHMHMHVYMFVDLYMYMWMVVMLSCVCRLSRYTSLQCKSERR